MWHPARFSISFIFLSWASIVNSQSCTLQVPQNPLTAQGLATPYQLTGCNQLDFANEGVFVEAVIIDPATGEIQIYSPLVINAGMTPVGNTSTSSSASAAATFTSTSSKANNTMTSSATSSSAKVSSSSSVKTHNGNTIGGTPTSTLTSSSSSSKNGNRATTLSTTSSSSESAGTKVARAAATQGAGFFIPPIVPTLPANAVVGLWFGSNAQSVTLTGDTATCVNGLGNSVFGQFAYCNAQAWFSAAITTVQSGLTKITAPGTGSGQACPTIRDFRIVDQDQSDNVVTTYLMIGGNTLAQNTPATSQANPDAEVLSNASDNALISDFIQPTLGCTPYTNPCTTCANGQSAALATNELQASFFPPTAGTAMVPLNDPMVLVNGQQSLQKVNLYRAGVNQAHADSANASGTTYCQEFTQSGLFISMNQQLFSGAASPAADQATNLFTFLAMRFSMSFGSAPGLGCTQLLNVANPVTLTTDGNGVVTAATINTQELQQIAGGTATSTTQSSTSTFKSSTSTTKFSTGTTKSSTSTSASSASTSQSSSRATQSSSRTTQSSSRATQSTNSTPAVRLVSTTSVMTTSMTTTIVSLGQSSTTPATTSMPAVTSCSSAVTVTVTVTATSCPSPHHHGPHSAHPPSSSTTQYWVRGVPVKQHSRMQKKRHSSSW